MNERRLKRLEARIQERVAMMVTTEMADPRRGMITITRVELDSELAHCKIFWSVLGDDAARGRNAAVLEGAAPWVQRDLARILGMRTVPRVRFVFDESIAGATRVLGIIERLREEREAREAREARERAAAEGDAESAAGD